MSKKIDRRYPSFPENTRESPIRSDSSEHAALALILQIHERRDEGLRVHGSARGLLQVRHVLRAGEEHPLRSHPVAREYIM